MVRNCAFTVAKVIVSCSISSLKTALIRASLLSYHELFEVLGIKASDADGLRLTEILFGLAVMVRSGWSDLMHYVAQLLGGLN